MGRKSQRALEKLGVDVRLNAMVSNVTEESVTYKNTKDDSEHTLTGATKIWSAGVAASPLARLIGEQAGVEVDRAGRVSTNDDLTVGEYSNVYAIGDLMGLKRLPGLAQVAMQGGAHAAKLIGAKVDEESTVNENEAFDYFDKGTMAIISRGYAVVKMGKTEMTGFIGWLAWLGLHITYVKGFRNRLVSLINWVENFFTRSRGNVEITKQQAYARNIIDNSKKQEVK